MPPLSSSILENCNNSLAMWQLLSPMAWKVERSVWLTFGFKKKKENVIYKNLGELSLCNTLGQQ